MLILPGLSTTSPRDLQSPTSLSSLWSSAPLWSPSSSDELRRSFQHLGSFQIVWLSPNDVLRRYSKQVTNKYGLVLSKLTIGTSASPRDFESEQNVNGRKKGCPMFKAVTRIYLIESRRLFWKQWFSIEPKWWDRQKGVGDNDGGWVLSLVGGSTPLMAACSADQRAVLSCSPISPTLQFLLFWLHTCYPASGSTFTMTNSPAPPSRWQLREKCSPTQPIPVRDAIT